MIDFIIPHMGRPELLNQTLNSILCQEDVDLLNRIFVVSKNSKPPEVPDHPSIEVHSLPNAKTISEQRNYGVKQSKSDIIVFMDADIELSPTWLGTCFKLIESNPSRIAVSAKQSNKFNNNVEKIRTALCYSGDDKNLSVMPVVNLMVYRKKHIEVGGFPEHLQTCEDTFYTECLSSVGQLYYTNSTYFYHLGEDHSLKQTFTKEIWRSEYNVSSLKGRIVPIRELPSILLPFWIAINLLLSLISITVMNPIALYLFILMSIFPILIYGIRLKFKKTVDVTLLNVFFFYSSYFFARTIGTLKGLRFMVSRKTL